MKKGETKWRQTISDYVTANFTLENRGWEYYTSNDPRLLMLPQGAYGSWVNYHNDAIRGERESAKLKGMLNRLAELCTRIQPLAATLNERVNKYEGLYTKGIIALENCKLEEATAFAKQLQSLETGECGHFFPRPYGKTKSVDLQEKINKIKATGKCGTKKGVYTLASVVPFQGNDYYKISETVYEYKSDKGGYIFTLQNPPPLAISPKETFDISISAKCLEKDPVLDYYTNNIWTAGESRVAFAGNKNIIVGKFEGKVITEANETLKITVPEFDGPELNLVLRIGRASYSEPTSYEWVKFVYKKG
jgi:hypothetical protein